MLCKNGRQGHHGFTYEEKTNNIMKDYINILTDWYLFAYVLNSCNYTSFPIHVKLLYNSKSSICLSIPNISLCIECLQWFRSFKIIVKIDNEQKSFDLRSLSGAYLHLKSPERNMNNKDRKFYEFSFVLQLTLDS